MADQLRAAQDAAIWNAIEANNFKQALKLVDKRLSKKHTDYLEVSGREDGAAIALHSGPCFGIDTT
jgi:hypothetical protein